MSKKMASVLMAYGVALAALGLLLQNEAPTIARVTCIAGLAGGGLCLLWGVAALAGMKGRVWATLSAIASLVVLLIQAVHVWTTSVSEGASDVTIRLVVTMMFLLTIGMLLYLFHGERPPEFYNPKAAGRDNPSSRGQPAQPPAASRRP